MSSSNGKSQEAPNQEELNALLDSALKDFEGAGADANGASGEAKAEPDELWNEEFFINHAKTLGDRVNAIFSENDQLSPDQINLGFQKMAEAAALALQGDVTSEADGQKYAESISEALKGLKMGAENLEAPVSETDVANMFAGLQLGGEGEDIDGNPFLPFMQGMMQSLLSAEVLLPSIKELLEKYPKYLEDNAEKLSAEDKERFVKQQELFTVICTDLEGEKPDDAADVKQERFKRVLDNMQKLHECGQPPEEIVGDAGAPGLPSMDQSQCPMM